MSDETDNPQSQDAEPDVVIDAAVMTLEELRAAVIAQAQAEIEANRLADIAAYQGAQNG
jgi:hypothetical protein